MKKKGYIRFLYIGLLIIMVSSLTGCFKRKVKIEDLKSFHYSYTVGYYMNASISYEVKEDNDKYIVRIKDAGMPEEDAREYSLSKDKIKELEDLLNKSNIYRWNGFNKSDKRVMDGDSFSISINWGDYRNISAHGYMKYPKNYSEITGKIESWFSEIDTNKPKENTI